MPKKDEKVNEEVKESEAAIEAASEASNEVAVAETSDEVTSETQDEEAFSELQPESTIITDASEVDPNAPVTVQPVRFGSFEDLGQTQGETNKNLDILMDIKLQLTVELGRTELPIRKVLELTRGSIIELEKVAGEPVELYANGKLVAHGEVVVIEDNFGLRITSITDPESRISGV